MSSRPYRARFSDGQTAIGRSVMVHLGAGLEITAEDGSALQSWSYPGLSASMPVSWRDHDVLLRSREHAGATLFVTEPEFAAAILKKAPRLSSAAHRWRYAVPGLVLAALLLGGVAATWLLDLNPSQALAGLVPQGVRHTIGVRAAEGLAGEHTTCSAAEGTAALARLVDKLASASKHVGQFNVRVVDWDMVNAFAVPGEEIVVARGLIEEARSGDEVAGVIAHEMGHGIELHPEAAIIRSIGLTAATQLLLSGQSPTLTSLGRALLELRYSRDAERQADAHALEILKLARISPKPYAEFFERLDRQEKGGDAAPARPSERSTPTPPTDQASNGNEGGGDTTSVDVTEEWLSTHPPSPERARLAAAAATYDAEDAMSEQDWQALRSICGS